MNFLNVLMICSSILIGSCSGFKLPKCITEEEKGFSISWGSINNKIEQKSFYKLTADSQINLLIEDIGGRTKSSFIIEISPEEFCEIKAKFQKLMIDKQAINFPGEIQNFIEYKNMAKNVYFAAVWNNEFTNVGNKELREFFDFLDSKIKLKT